MSAKPALEPTLRALAARDRRSLSQHPTPEALVAYHSGELSGAEEEQLRDHLALCPDCADLLLDLVSFAEFNPPAEPATLANSEVEAAWQKVQPQIAGPKTPVVRPIREKHREAVAGDLVPRRRLAQAYAIAATLFLGVVGLSVWGISLQRRVHQQDRPQQVSYVDLLSKDDRERSGSKEEIVPPGGVHFVLFLHLPAGAVEAQAYSVEIRPADSTAAPTVELAGLIAKDGVCSLEVPREKFQPGVYRVALFGADRIQPVTSFGFGIPPH